MVWPREESIKPKRGRIGEKHSNTEAQKGWHLSLLTGMKT
jgi:hypothetical protein